ncbi:DNA-packaging protein gp3 [uncultured Caudovirales phage]|uniref:DNA-packaging protein gp3 n=1 Tax=uncultured Caudovirales phage TaxID=2100421 RepID=A0A6J5LLV4_9CAUD|nr:DNA-packaging protein gp3 [uncultured Caudovirales phage]
MLFKSVDELDEKIEEYFKTTQFGNDVPTITGLAVHLDTSRRTLLNYQDREDYFPSIKRALDKCEAAIEKRAMLGGLNATIAIFSLKNNYGWVDKTETDVTSKGEAIQGAVDATSAAAYAEFLKSKQ